MFKYIVVGFLILFSAAIAFIIFSPDSNSGDYKKTVGYQFTAFADGFSATFPQQPFREKKSMIVIRILDVLKQLRIQVKRMGLHMLFMFLSTVMLRLMSKEKITM